MVQSILLSLVGEANHEGAGGIFSSLINHLAPHEFEGVKLLGLPVYNYQLLQCFSVFLIFVLFGSLNSKFRAGELRGIWRVLGGWVLWIRDEMVYPVLGKVRGRRYLPFFLSIFFFILFCNLLGLIPIPPPFGGTATSSIFVTGALALITFSAVLILGMAEQGMFQFWKNLIPSGLPWWLLPLMIPVEIIGLTTKHCALMIRLWANMTGGHLILAIFLGLIFLFGSNLGMMAYGVAVPIVAFAAFIMIIEAFVALLQAYIFTLLSIIFIGAAVHPEH